MRFCKFAAIIALFFSIVSVATAAPEGLSPADRAVLADYARDTWRSIVALADRGPLPADSLRRTFSTTARFSPAPTARSIRTRPSWSP